MFFLLLGFVGFWSLADAPGAEQSEREAISYRLLEPPGGAGEQSQCSEQAPEAFVAWAKHNAVRITTTEPGNDFRDLQPLKKIVGNARVVALGESVHMAHEFYQVRHRLLQFLVEEMGFTAFAMETGFAEAVKINDYVLGRVNEPERWQHNWFTWGFGYEEELLALVRWMRRYNEDPRHTRKIHFYGIDLAVPYSSPLTAIDGALTYLDKVDPEYATSMRSQKLLPLVGKFLGSGGGDDVRLVSLNKYKKLSVEERNAYTAAIADLIAHFETKRIAYIRNSSEDEYEWTYHDAIAARQLDTAYRATADEKAEDEHTPRAAWRDRAMANNVLWALQREGPRGRIVLWAHNSHIMKSFYPNIGACLGLFLDSILGPDYVSVGFTYYQGAKSGWRSWQTGASDRAKCGTLDGELARLGLPMYVLDLRSVPRQGPAWEWLNQVHIMRSPPLELNPLQAWDALFHIRRISPARGQYEVK